MIVLLLACAPHAAAPPIAPLPAAPVATPAPGVPVGWSTGRVDAAPIRARPTSTWSRTLATPATVPLATDGERVFVAADGRLAAYSLDGALAWTLPGDVVAAPVATAEGLWVPGGDRLRLVDPATGQVRDEGPLDVAPDTSPATGEDLRWVTFDGRLVSGAGWSVPVGGRPAGPPAVDGARTYVVTRAGDLLAVDRAGVAWSVALGAPARGGPSLDPTHVYVPFGARGTLPGGVVAVGRDGVEAWRWTGSVEPGAGLATGPAVYVPDRGERLVALDPATGAVLWDLEGFGPFTTRPLLAGSFLYAANGDGNLYAVDVADGGVAWTLALGAPPSTDPVLAGGQIVLALADGRVVAFGDR